MQVCVLCMSLQRHATTYRTHVIAAGVFGRLSLHATAVLSGSACASPNACVHVLLCCYCPADGQYETLALNPGEPIRDLTMKLTNRGWFSSKSCLVFG